MGGRRNGRTHLGAGRSRPPTAGGPAPKTLPRAMGQMREDAARGDPRHRRAAMPHQLRPPAGRRAGAGRAADAHRWAGLRVGLLYGDRAAGVAMLFEVTLVILLGPVKRGRRGDLGDDLPPARLLLGVARCDRGVLLASVMVEDRRAVLATEIEALAIAGGRIVDPPEHLEQLRVADLGRVEPHLDRLGVAGAVPADLPVAGVHHVAAGVADSGLQHPMDLAEGRLHTPEASRGECRALGSIRSVSLERRCQRRTGVAVPELHHVMTSSNTSASTKPAPGIPARAPGDATP